MNALSTLSQLPETREQQHAFAHKAIEELLNGDYDLLKVWVQMSIVADTLEEIKKSETLKQAVTTELMKHGKEGTTVNNCKLTLTTRRNFDFSACNHAAYNKSVAIVEHHKKQIKDIEAFL